MTTTKKPSPFRDCLKCGMPVHARSPACKACGAPSPWTAPEAHTVVASEDMAAGGVPPAGADATPDPELTAAVAALRVIDATTDDFNPSPEQVAVFLHDITSPARAEAAEREAELAARTGPHVFLEKHSTMIGETIAHFKAGQIVTDFALIQVLKAQGNAPMVPTAHAPGMTCCPRCSHIFKVPSVLPTRRTG